MQKMVHRFHIFSLPTVVLFSVGLRWGDIQTIWAILTLVPSLIKRKKLGVIFFSSERERERERDLIFPLIDGGEEIWNVWRINGKAKNKKRKIEQCIGTPKKLRKTKDSFWLTQNKAQAQVNQNFFLIEKQNTHKKES